MKLGHARPYPRRLNRKQCPACKKRIAIRTDGRLRKHNAADLAVALNNLADWYEQVPGGGTLIFKPELARKVLDGSKTMTRRAGIRTYTVGREYAVQPGRGKFHVGHVTILSSHSERLRQITNRDALAEGFKDVSDFMEGWMRINGVWNPEAPVMAYRLGAVEVRECCAELREVGL